MVDLFVGVGDELHVALRQAADEGPLTTEASTGATVVLRHADVEGLARDPRLAGVGLVLFDVMGITDGPLRDWYGGLMFTNEGETHDRLRKLVSRAFTPRSVEALRRDAADLSAQAVNRIATNGGGDLIDELRLLAMRVMCRLLGVPESDVAVFGAWADALSPVFGFMDPAEIAAATDAITALLDYVRELAERRRSDPGDDLITGLLEASDGADQLSGEELVAMVANLLVGGHDTTTSQVGCSLLTLLRYREEAERLRSDLQLLVSAVEETIRFEPSLIGVPRTALEPLTVGGKDLPPGSLVILCTASANREPGVWKEPDTFDVARFATKGSPALLSFGAGPHFCLGAALARVTLQECVAAVARSEPALELAEDPSGLEWRIVLGRSPARLPVVAA